MDARSWAEQGREAPVALVEPNLLGGEGNKAEELREHVENLRRQRAELPAPHLEQAAALELIEREARGRRPRHSYIPNRLLPV